MNKEEIEILIGSYLAKAREISFRFSNGTLGNQNYIQDFVDGMRKLVNPKPLIEYKINNFNEFLDELLEIKNRINELKDSDINENNK